MQLCHQIVHKSRSSQRHPRQLAARLVDTEDGSRESRQDRRALFFIAHEFFSRASSFQRAGFFPRASVFLGARIEKVQHVLNFSTARAPALAHFSFSALAACPLLCAAHKSGQVLRGKKEKWASSPCAAFEFRTVFQKRCQCSAQFPFGAPLARTISWVPWKIVRDIFRAEFAFARMFSRHTE